MTASRKTSVHQVVSNEARKDKIVAQERHAWYHDEYGILQTCSSLYSTGTVPRMDATLTRQFVNQTRFELNVF
jgi:hypothetical protein